jgi:outer membrane protein assembly factor BamB
MSRLSPLLIAVAVLASVLSGRAGDWPAWHGGERQGLLDGAGYPVRWSATSNIAWKTAIPGAGHSSPVLAGDRVFVSTSYESNRGERIRWVADVVVWLAMLGAVLLAVPLVADALTRGPAGRPAPASFLAAAALLVLWIGLLVLAQFGPSLFDFSRCPIRAWLASGFGFTLCVAASAFGLPGRAVRRLVLAGLCVLLSVVVIAAVPFKDHALRGLRFPPTNNSVVMLLAAGFPLAVGLRLAIGWRAGGSTFWSGPMFENGRWPSRRRLVAEMLCVAPAALGLGVLLLQSRVWTAAPHMDVPREEAVLVPSWLALAGAAVAALAVGVALRSDAARRRAGPLLVMAVALAAVVAGAGAAERLLVRIPYLSYHWGKPAWDPVVGWPLAGLSAAVAGAAFLLAPFRRGRGGAAAIRRHSTVALLAGASLFVRTNWLHESGEKLRAIHCLDQASGQLIWKCEVSAEPATQADRRNTEATPTPVVAEGRVMAYFGGGELVCCGLDGRLAWVRRDLPFGGLYGAASSPVAADGIVVVQCDRSQRGAKVWGLDIRTGETRWCADLPDEKNPYGNHRTPAILPWQDRRAALVWRFNELVALDLKTGARLRSQALEGSGDLVASAVSDGDVVYLTQHEGTLAVSLLDWAAGREPVLWRQQARGSNCSSPALAAASLLLVTERGKVQCINVKTGELRWGASLHGLFWPSVVAGEGRAYFTNTDGVTTVLDIGTGQPVATNALGEEVYASLAGSDKALYVRGIRHIIKIGTAEGH